MKDTRKCSCGFIRHVQKNYGAKDHTRQELNARFLERANVRVQGDRKFIGIAVLAALTENA